MSAMAYTLRRPLVFLYPTSVQGQLCTRSISTSRVQHKAEKASAQLPKTQTRGVKPAFKKKVDQGRAKPPHRNPPQVNYAEVDAAWFKPTKPELPMPQLKSELQQTFEQLMSGGEAIEEESLVPFKVGEPWAYPDVALKAFKVSGLPGRATWETAAFTKPVFQQEYFSKPFSVVTETTERLVGELHQLKDQVRESAEPTGLVLHGPSGCGKSTLLMQAVTYGLQNGWVVLYIGRSTEIVNSTSPYHYDPRTKLFQQPQIAHNLLKVLQVVNSAALANIQVDQDVVYSDKGQTFVAGGALQRLVDVGLEPETDKVVVLEAVLDQLGRQTDFPVMFAIDDYQTFYCNSVYRDPQFFPIKSYDLSIPRLFLEYAIGTRQLSRGVILGAIGALHTRWNTPLPLREAIGAEISWRDAVAGGYAPRHKDQVYYAKGLKGFAVPHEFGIEAARGWYETWHNGLVMHSRPSDEFFLAKYTEAAGNAREFARQMLGTLQ